MDAPATYPLAPSSAHPYRCPAPDGPRAAYLTWIDGLPAAPDPGAFGLHPNADISKELSATDAMVASLLGMSGGGGGGGGSGGGEAADGGSSGVEGEGGGGSGGGGGGGTPEEARLSALVAECLAALPAAPFDLEAFGARHPVCHEESMNTVLVQVGLAWGVTGGERCLMMMVVYDLALQPLRPAAAQILLLLQ